MCLARFRFGVRSDFVFERRPVERVATSIEEHLRPNENAVGTLMQLDPHFGFQLARTRHSPSSFSHPRKPLGGGKGGLARPRAVEHRARGLFEHLGPDRRLEYRRAEPQRLRLGEGEIGKRFLERKGRQGDGRSPGCL